MTIAMILTTAISLGLLGGGLIIARMTDQMRDIYGDKVEVTVYLTTDLSDAGPGLPRCHLPGHQTQLKHNTDVETIDFQSQAAAFERYKQQFAGQPEMLDIGTPRGAVGVFPRQAVRPAAVSRRSPSIRRQAGSAVGHRPECLPGPAVRPAERRPQRDHHRGADPGVRRAAADLQHGADRRVHQAHRDLDHAAGRSVPMANPAAVHVEAVVAGVIGAVLAIVRLGRGQVRLRRQVARLGDPLRDPAPVDRRPTLVWVSPWLAGIAVALAALSAYVTLRLYVRI